MTLFASHKSHTHSREPVAKAAGVGERDAVQEAQEGGRRGAPTHGQSRASNSARPSWVDLARTRRRRGWRWSPSAMQQRWSLSTTDRKWSCASTTQRSGFQSLETRVVLELGFHQCPSSELIPLGSHLPRVLQVPATVSRGKALEKPHLEGTTVECHPCLLRAFGQPLLQVFPSILQAG